MWQYWQLYKYKLIWWIKPDTDLSPDSTVGKQTGLILVCVLKPLITPLLAHRLNWGLIPVCECCVSSRQPISCLRRDSLFLCGMSLNSATRWPATRFDPMYAIAGRSLWWATLTPRCCKTLMHTWSTSPLVHMMTKAPPTFGEWANGDRVCWWAKGCSYRTIYPDHTRICGCSTEKKLEFITDTSEWWSWLSLQVSFITIWVHSAWRKKAT